jgi:hypothetical protein
MSWRGLLLTCLGLVSTVIAANEAASGVTGLLGDVVFNQYAPLSSSAELARRLVSPLNARRLQQQATATGVAIRDQPIDLAQERFAVAMRCWCSYRRGTRRRYRLSGLPRCKSRA